MSSTPKTPSYDPTGYSDYAAQLADDYTQEQALLQQLDENLISITQYNQDIASQEKAGSWHTEIVGGTWDMHTTRYWVSHTNQTQVNNDEAAIAALEAADDKISAAIKKLDPLIGDSIDNLINAVKSETKEATSGDKIAGGGPKQDLTEDLATMEQAIKALMTYVMDKIQADYYQQMVMHEGPDNFDYSAFAKLMGLQNDMQGVMSNLEDGLQNGFYDSNGNLIADGLKQYILDKNAADADQDEKSSFGWEISNFGTDPSKDIARDNQRIDNDNDMISFIQSIAGGVGAAASSIDPNVTGALILIDLAVKKIFELVGHGPITASEKQAVLDVLFEVLGFLQQMLAAVSQQKGKDEQEMEKDAKFNSEIQQSDILLQQQKAETAKLNAAAMDIVMKVATGIMTAVAMVIAPGVGSMFGALMMGVLSESGVLEKGAQALGGGIAGEAIMGAIAAVAGGGISVGLDIAAAKVALKIALTVATEVGTAVVEAVEEGVESAVSTIVGDATETAAARGAADAVLNQGLKTAAKTAEQQVLKEFLSQNVMAMVKSGAQGLKEAIVERVTQAIAIAKEELAPMAQKAAESAAEAVEGGATPAAAIADATPPVVMDEASTIGAEAGYEATESEAPSALGKFADSNTGKFLGRAAAWDLFTMASTNFFVDVYTSTTKLDKDSKEYQIILALIGVVQGLIQAVSQAGGSGFLTSPGSKLTDITSLMQFANFVQTFATLMEGTASGLTASSQMTEADALQNISNDTAKLNAFQSMLDRILQGAKAHTQKDQNEQKQEAESVNTMALHLYDAEKVYADMIGHAVV